MNGWRHNTRSKFKHMWNISTTFLWKLVQSRQNSRIQNDSKLKKSTVEMLLNELFSLDEKENEIKMEEYADEIDVKISV